MSDKGTHQSSPNTPIVGAIAIIDTDTFTLADRFDIDTDPLNGRPQRLYLCTNTQPSILMYYNSTQAAGTTITLEAKDGNSVATYTLYSGNTKIVDFTLSDSSTYLSESGVTTKLQNAGPGGGGRRPSGASNMPPC